MGRNITSDSSCWPRYRARVTSIHWWCECKLVQSVWETVMAVVQKMGIYLSQDSIIPLEHIPKRWFILLQSTCLTSFIVAPFVSAGNWKQPRCSPNRTDKENVDHLNNVILLNFKKKDVMKISGKWMELVKIILIKVRQSKKDNYSMYSLISGY